MKYRYTIIMKNLDDEFDDIEFMKDIDDFIQNNEQTYYLSRENYQIKIEDEECIKLNDKRK